MSTSEPLVDVFRDLRLTDGRYVQSRLAAPWGMRIEGCGRAVFHFVARGACVLRQDGEVRHLAQGAFVLLPHGRTHALLDTPESPVQVLSALAREPIAPRGVAVSNDGDGPPTTLLSGSFLFVPHPIVAELPEAITVHPGDRPGGHDERLIACLVDEVATAAPGSETVVDRLGDVLVIRAIRSWLATVPATRRGWLGALRHPGLGRALALIHTQPARPWSLEDLAGEAGMSRASFAKAFAEQVGTPPIRFLTDRRMQLARRWLQQEALGVAEVAERLGYSSGAAFSRAFKRHTGVPPRAVARQRA